MKKTLIILLVMSMLLISFAGCTGPSVPEKKAVEEATKVEATEEAATEVTEEKTEEETKEAEVVEETEKESLVDKSLSGVALLQSVVTKPLKEFVMTMETQMGERSSISTTYTKGESSRSETEDASLGVKAIVIYNAEEGATYQYNEGETTGVVLLDGEDDEESMDMDAGFEMPSLKDLINSSEENITAKMDTLNGEEVIYIEATEADEDMGEVNVYMWYSTKYSYPLKYELYMNGQLFFTTLVTNIDTKTKVDDALFQKPDGIEFQEFSFDNMFGE